MWNNPHLQLINAAQPTFYLAPRQPCVGPWEGRHALKAAERGASREQKVDEDMRLTRSGKEGKEQDG